MGLDCYIMHNDCKTDFTSKDDPRIKDIDLCRWDDERQRG
jgi:hypothetical protein